MANLELPEEDSKQSDGQRRALKFAIRSKLSQSGAVLPKKFGFPISNRIPILAWPKQCLSAN